MRALFSMVGSVLVSLLVVCACPGCKKKTPAPAAQQQQQNPDDPVVARGPGGGVVAGAPAVAGGGGGGGTVQAIRGAVGRTVTANDLQQIRTFIENASLASGRMPTPQQTLAALKQEAPKIAELVDDGTIVLHNAKTRESVWAYEKKAYDQGGMVLTNQGVERMDAATLRQRLQQ
jgi:hypothetical protein